MEKTKNKLLITFFTLFLVFLATAIVFCTLFAVSHKKLSAYGTTLENSFQNNFFNLTANVSNIEVKLSKVVVSADRKMQSKVLDEIWKECNMAQKNLSALPLSTKNGLEAMKFINQVGGFCYSLAEKVNLGQSLNQNDYADLNRLCQDCKSLKENLEILGEQIAVGSFKLSKNLNSGLDDDLIGQAFENNKNNYEETPELIYDGPYSNSLSDLEVKGLSGDGISVEEATSFVREVFAPYSITKIQFVGEGEGDIESYNFNLTTLSKDTIFVQIAKQEKFLLQFNRNSDVTREVDESEIDETELLQIAQNFCQNLGLENMSAIFISVGQGLAYINVAPKVDGIVYYPDIVKIKINLYSKNIVGFEAKSYAFNHIERTISNPTYTIEQAEEKLSDFLQVAQKRLALISKEFGGEVLCFEFECSYNDDLFYVYLNANTLEEEEIFRVVKNTEGKLVL